MKYIVIILNVCSVALVVGSAFWIAMLGMGQAFVINNTSSLSKPDIYALLWCVFLIGTGFLIWMSHRSTSVPSYVWALLPFILFFVLLFIGRVWLSVKRHIWAREQAEYSVQEAKRASEEALDTAQKLLNE